MSMLEDWCAWLFGWAGVGYYQHFKDQMGGYHIIGPFSKLDVIYKFRDEKVKISGLVAVRFHVFRPKKSRKPKFVRSR